MLSSYYTVEYAAAVSLTQPSDANPKQYTALGTQAPYRCPQYIVVHKCYTCGCAVQYHAIKPVRLCWLLSIKQDSEVQSFATVGRVFDSRRERLGRCRLPHTLAVRLYLGETASSSMNERYFIGDTRVWTIVSVCNDDSRLNFVEAMTQDKVPPVLP